MNHQHFFSFDLDKSLAMPEEYNISIVLLSYLVAVFAGYCASSLNQFIALKRNEGSVSSLTVFGGAILGLGIWSMHFVGMLAFSVPVPVKYDVATTLVSILPAILGSWLFIVFINKGHHTPVRIAFNALMLALGIAAMHFIGMAAMSMNAVMVHDPLLFASSILASWMLAIVTLQIQLKRLQLQDLLKTSVTPSFASPLVFGFSVATMHYLAMQSAYFLPSHQELPIEGADVEGLGLGVIIGVVLLVFSLSVVLTFKQKILMLNQRAKVSHTQLAETIETMRDPFMLTDENHQILFSNQSFLDNFGLPEHKNLHDIKRADLLEYIFDSLAVFKDDSSKQKLLETIENSDECTFVTKNGNTWLFRQSRTSSNNNILSWTNITKEIQHREALLEAKEEAYNALQTLQKTKSDLLEAQNLAAIGKLVTNVAHELNTPIGVAVTSLSCIKQEVEELESMFRRGELSKSALNTSLVAISECETLASRNMTRAANVIQQFKFISVTEFTERSQRTNLRNTFASIATYLEKLGEEKDIKVNVEIDGDIFIETYEDALFQVINSLFNNSLIHGFEQRDNGQVNIRVANTNEGVIIDFNDNGKGIHEDVVNNIFEPFVSTRRMDGNMGLGLHIVHNIVCLKMHGALTLISSGENGCTFRIELPCQTKAKRVEID